ncbi:MAG: hypothetical protein ACREUN_14680, partial [Burkholderiales bacterium]
MSPRVRQALRKSFELLYSVPTRIFGSRNERLLKQYVAVVAQINALEPAMAQLSDPQLRGKTEELRKRLAEGATMDELL